MIDTGARSPLYSVLVHHSKARRTRNRAWALPTPCQSGHRLTLRRKASWCRRRIQSRWYVCHRARTCDGSPSRIYVGLSRFLAKAVTGRRDRLMTYGSETPKRHPALSHRCLDTLNPRASRWLTRTRDTGGPRQRCTRQAVTAPMPLGERRWLLVSLGRSQKFRRCTHRNKGLVCGLWPKVHAKRERLMHVSACQGGNR